MRFVLFFQFVVCFSHLWGILLCLSVIHGNNYSLECLNDYLYTIRCELNLTSAPQPDDALYWLEFYDEREPFECMLTSQTYPWVCVLNLSTRVDETFTDLDSFQISLNYSCHANNGSVVLEKEYRPVDYIQPVPPSNLMLLWKPDELVFSWSNGYNGRVFLVPNLKYQLSIQRNGKVLVVQSALTTVSVLMSVFVPDTDYKAHVRSAPQQVNYKGVWSHWGPSINWTTGPTNIKKSKSPEADTDTSFPAVCLTVFVLPLILLGFFLYTRWKKCVLNQSPVPHIEAFKLPEKVGELLHREESLQIDSLHEDTHSIQCENINETNDGPGHASLPGSPNLLRCDVDSKVSMSSWVQALMSAEKGSVTYSDDYCVLSHTLAEHAVKC